MFYVEQGMSLNYYVFNDEDDDFCQGPYFFKAEAEEAKDELNEGSL